MAARGLAARTILESLTDHPIEIAVDTEYCGVETLTIQAACGTRFQRAGHPALSCCEHPKSAERFPGS